ncbi:MAG: polysaccharide biosynthesis protein [Nitrospiraceae bacterium]|nr:polysaccharide biosynthesis protein [Nitrospiraceae bacterium]
MQILFKGQYARQGLVYFIDLIICFFSIAIAYLLRFNFSIPSEYVSTLPYVMLYVGVVRALSFLIFKSYVGIIRYTTIKDIERIIIVVFFGSAFFIIVNQIFFYFINNQNLIPYGVLIIDFFVMVFIMTSSRLLVKNIYMEIKSPTNRKTNVIIFGAGNLGNITKQSIEQEMDLHYKVVAFIDDDHDVIGKTLERIKVYSNNHLDSLLKKYRISKFIFTKKPKDKLGQYELVDTCLKYNVQVLSIPPVETWINGELSIKQLRRFKIEDLLGRSSIRLNNSQRGVEYKDKCIMITGAAGSIGSEIVHQMIRYHPRKLILVDQAESPLYFLDLQVSEKYNCKHYITLLGDISDEEKMEMIFRAYSPQIIFHAAAYKHVPVLEEFPSEAVRVNIHGTKVLAELAVKYKVERFIMISTDKAVNPTNVMGASKRIAEICTQSLNKKGVTRFITTRFGNVLGSNGSVIPRFKDQIKVGGIVTVTHPEVTRFFMTIPEAVDLVFEAGVMGKGGEIFIFDMGKSVKILDLAKKMILLSGLIPDKDVQIKFTGLRPGEKLYEELLNDQEKTIPTYHPKIMIAKVREYDPETIQMQIAELIQMKNDEDPFHIVGKMKQIVPEYKSKNSVFERLDKEDSVLEENKNKE